MNVSYSNIAKQLEIRIKAIDEEILKLENNDEARKKVHQLKHLRNKISISSIIKDQSFFIILKLRYVM